MSNLLKIVLIAIAFAIACDCSALRSACVNRIYTATGNGEMAVSLDDGETWTRRDVPKREPDYPGDEFWLNAISADGDSVYVATGQGLHVSRNGGVDWKLVKLNPDGSNHLLIRFVYIDNYHRVYAVGETASTGQYWMSEDRGETWLSHRYPESCVFWLPFVVFTSNNRSYVGMRHGVAKSDNGRNWDLVRTPIDVPYHPEVYAINGRGSSIYVGLPIPGAALYISEDNGGTWRQQYTSRVTGYRNYVTSIAVTEDKIYVANWGFGVSVSGDGGKSWVESASLASGKVNEIHAIGNSVFAGTDNGLSISRDAGKTWTTKDVGLPSKRVTVFAHCV